MLCLVVICFGFLSGYKAISNICFYIITLSDQMCCSLSEENREGGVSFTIQNTSAVQVEATSVENITYFPCKPILGCGLSKSSLS